MKYLYYSQFLYSSEEEINTSINIKFKLQMCAVKKWKFTNFNFES